MRHGIVFLDCDGVLTDNHSSWMKLHEHFGSRDNSFFAELYRRGIISYLDWMKIDIALMINAWGKPITRRDVEEALADIRVREEAIMFTKTLKSMGYTVAVISSGVDLLVKRVCMEIGADICLYNELLFIDDTLVPGGRPWVPLKEKPFIVEKMAAALGARREDTVYVGDSVWDNMVFPHVGIGIAIGGCGERCSNAHYHVDTLSEALDIILGRRERVKR